MACVAADANAVALANDVIIRGVQEHLEQAHPVVQVVKLGMDARDDRLGEFVERVFEVLNETQCHLNHDVRDHVCWRVFAALYFSPRANALPVFVDFLALNLCHANHHFEMVVQLFQQRQNGQSVFATQSGFRVALIKFTLDGKKVIAEQFSATSHDAQRRCFHFLYQQQMNQERCKERYNDVRTDITMSGTI